MLEYRIIRLNLTISDNAVSYSGYFTSHSGFCSLVSAVKDAKSEIFRTLSMLSVSKNRFKSLLKWLKTFKLEDIKNGLYESN